MSFEVTFTPTNNDRSLKISGDGAEIFLGVNDQEGDFHYASLSPEEVAKVIAYLRLCVKENQ